MADDTFHEYSEDFAQADTVNLPALHYLPRTFDEDWTPGTIGCAMSRPSYLSVGGEPVIFCLCGRVRDVRLSADDGSPIEHVFVDIAPLHPADGNALINLIIRAGYRARGEYMLYTVFYFMLMPRLVQKDMGL